jgi:integrative and conjugative element protein (TIGR02256 family)
MPRMRDVSLRLTTAWMRDAAVDLMLEEATRRAPNETGGVLMGYADRHGHSFLVENAVGPGPQAAHSRTRFLPDHDFHESEIARIYEESGRRITYLGDWHTHPQGSGHLSHRDLKTLASIAADSRARAPIPLMTILAGLEWSLFVWKGELVQRRFARAKLVVEPVRFAQIGPARSPQSV